MKTISEDPRVRALIWSAAVSSGHLAFDPKARVWRGKRVAEAQARYARLRV